jgi:mannose-1-phosphate guanylyltransferase/mannose-6-phosphate isomerase
MIVVIIAGGSGTRLWPLSTPHYPKHLLNLIGTSGAGGTDGVGGTLLQDTVKRAQRVAKDDVYIITDASHAAHVAEQVPQIEASHILIEPGRRGTANCILYALDVLKRGGKGNDGLCFIHCDHVIKNENGFADSIKKAACISLKTKKIVLCGVIPNYASSAFGYIEKSKSDGVDLDGAFGVASFKEKPNPQTAKQYLESGEFLWNTGYFTASVEIFLNEIKKYSPDMVCNYEKLSAVKIIGSKEYEAVYLSLKSEAIDYALMERDSELLVLPASFDWADVGNFKDLYDIVEKDISGNCLCGNIYNIESKNMFVRNTEDKPLAVIGLEDIIVINTKDGILVSKRDCSPLAGDVAKILEK